jgi:hypothetical protein
VYGLYPSSWPSCAEARIGTCDMFCTPPAMTTSIVPDITACAAKCTACWAEPHWRSIVTPRDVLGQPTDERARAGDVARLRADRVEAAEHDVVDGVRVDLRALHQRLDHVAAQVGRVDLGQAAPASAHGRADGFDDERF